METNDATKRQALEAMPKEILISLVLKLEALVSEQQLMLAKQQESIANLQAEVARLHGIAAKNSQNSHRPPSKDDPNRPKKTRSQRKKSKRRAGGQKGHKGSTLSQVENPDAKIMHLPASCENCSSPLRGVASSLVQSRQVFDVPTMKIHVTQHEQRQCLCPGCGKINVGQFPAYLPVGLTSYGENLQALVTYLSVYQLLPYERMAELIEDLLGHRISVGTLCNMTKRSYSACEDMSEDIKATIIKASVAHFDETGCRVEGDRDWLHVASTATETHYEVHEKRGQEAMDAIGILPAFKGRAVHDHWKAYFAYENCDHGLCNSHHIRELAYFAEEDGITWAQDMLDHLVTIKDSVDRAKAKGVQALDPRLLGRLENRYDEIIQAGRYSCAQRKRRSMLPSAPPGKRGRKKQEPIKNLLDRLEEHRSEVLISMHDFSVPWDNNLGERDIRMAKVKEKISGCYRSEMGAKIFCRIRGCISTARKHGRHVLAALTETIVLNRTVYA